LKAYKLRIHPVKTALILDVALSYKHYSKFPYVTKHILSERSESQGSIFCDRSDIWTEMY